MPFSVPFSLTRSSYVRSQNDNLLKSFSELSKLESEEERHRICVYVYRTEMLVGSVNFRLFHAHLGDSVDRNGARTNGC